MTKGRGNATRVSTLSNQTIREAGVSDIGRQAEEEAADPAVADTEESREAAAEGENPQDFRAERETAESHTAFGDDKVTPRLNDGR